MSGPVIVWKGDLNQRAYRIVVCPGLQHPCAVSQGYVVVERATKDAMDVETWDRIDEDQPCYVRALESLAIEQAGRMAAAGPG